MKFLAYLSLLLLAIGGYADAQVATPFIPSTVVTGPASATSGNCASFNGTTGKIIQDSGGSCGGGGASLLATLTASSSASLVDTTHLTSTYKSYEFRFINIIPATDNVNFEAFLSTNAGVSYDTTSTNYKLLDVLLSLSNAASAIAPVPASSGSGLLPSGQSGEFITNSSSYPLTGVLTLYNPAGAIFKGFDYRLSMARTTPTPGYYTSGGGQYVGSTSAVNGIEFIMSGGNIASGSVEIWGIP